MVKRSGSIRERRAVDGKLRSHLEWPYTVAIAYIVLSLFSQEIKIFNHNDDQALN